MDQQEQAPPPDRPGGLATEAGVDEQPHPDPEQREPGDDAAPGPHAGVASDPLGIGAGGPELVVQGRARLRGVGSRPPLPLPVPSRRSPPACPAS